MPPELHMQTDYNGKQLDLFSIAVILFVMVKGDPPFSSASVSDANYKNICQNKNRSFWTEHL